MTTSSIKSPVTRESSAYFRQSGMRAIVVTVTGSIIEMRLKGCRQREVVDIASIYQGAIKARVFAELKAKK